MKIFNTIAFACICLFSSNVIAPGAPVAKPAKPADAGTKPLTYANVVSSFKEAHLRATEVQRRCTIFFEGEWKNANVYDYCVIMVENFDEDVQVTFYLTDAHEMNWVTEFLDSSFFNRNETEALFRLMNAGSDVRGQNMGRFRVDFPSLAAAPCGDFCIRLHVSSRVGNFRDDELKFGDHDEVRTAIRSISGQKSSPDFSAANRSHLRRGVAGAHR